jgi:hypothetical protein
MRAAGPSLGPDAHGHEAQTAWYFLDIDTRENRVVRLASSRTDRRSMNLFPSVLRVQTPDGRTPPSRVS